LELQIFILPPFPKLGCLKFSIPSLSFNQNQFGRFLLFSFAEIMELFLSDSFNISPQNPLNTPSPPFPAFTDEDDEIPIDVPVFHDDNHEENGTDIPN